jgi:hypothetical protein
MSAQDWESARNTVSQCLHLQPLNALCQVLCERLTAILTLRLCNQCIFLWAWWRPKCSGNQALDIAASGGVYCDCLDIMTFAQYASCHAYLYVGMRGGSRCDVVYFLLLVVMA